MRYFFIEDEGGEYDIVAANNEKEACKYYEKETLLGEEEYKSKEIFSDSFTMYDFSSGEEIPPEEWCGDNKHFPCFIGGSNV